MGPNTAHCAEGNTRERTCPVVPFRRGCREDARTGERCRSDGAVNDAWQVSQRGWTFASHPGPQCVRDRRSNKEVCCVGFSHREFGR